MFLSLLTSVLLSVGVFSCAFQEKAVETPKIEKQFSYTGTNNVYGTYILKHVDDNEPYFTEQIADVDIQIVFYDYNTYRQFHVTNISPSLDYYGSFGVVDNLTISYYHADNEIFIDIDYYDSANRTFGIYEESTFDDLNSSNYHFEYFAINTQEFVYYTEEQMLLFNTLFTKQVSSFFTCYHGWYSTLPVISYTGADFGVLLYDNFSFNNSLFNSLEFGYYSSTHSFIIDAIFYNVLDDSTSRANIYNNGYLINQNHYYFNELYISNIALQRMQLIGTFTFLPSSQTYTLTDLFFDIGDTPVVFITGLFDFDFLGVNFSVAVMGILTLICMVFILKKVI